MFRNGPEMDGGDTAYLGPTTIIEMTIPRSQSSSAATLDDSGVLAGPIRYIKGHQFSIMHKGKFYRSGSQTRLVSWKILTSTLML